MNKTLTINLGGVVFNIEENAYQKLNKYSEGVKSYFSDVEGKEEIITDIESRIAEKFQAILKKEKRQALLDSDIDQVISEIGTPEDFKEFEDQEEPMYTENTFSQEASKEPRRLFRNEDDTVLGGVCSGLGAYLGVDPVVIRLAFILLLVFAGIGLIPYIILWIVLPKGKKSDFLETGEQFKKPPKKLYRDTENSMLGGVSAGLSAYFNIDPTIMRFLFIIATVWGGIGLLAYIILWIALPPARTIVERVEMKGQQARLKNIRSEHDKSL